ncbi:ABC transporter permease [Bacillus sp. FJAT-49705]|uniref:ABC transporter permease n=1 Tax=Cytobacillus citreus TaxID=2833586 RepID=A0ABS5NQR3_9BACI|nr:ABC transporter permease [Cytobacillus citreus]MBS4189809.1 ABC transporter permease [Cytobacillus citreus]
MLGHQLKAEFKRVATWRQFTIWMLLILVIPTIQFLLIKDNYVFYRHLDLFLRLNSNFIPLLFPIIMVLVNTIHFVGEQKNYFIQYTRIRIPLSTYLFSKLLTNAVLSFSIAFLITFIPFVFSMYIEPYLGIVKLYPTEGNPIPYTTFEQLLFLGTLPYGIIYSLWVGLNGMMYATIALLALMILEKSFIALSIPFMYYLLANFITQALGFDKFSPSNTIFPFSISQQPLWTVFVPFTILCIAVIILGLYLKENMNKRYE